MKTKEEIKTISDEIKENVRRLIAKEDMKRSLFKATKYLKMHPEVVSSAIGAAGICSSIVTIREVAMRDPEKIKKYLKQIESGS